jgi:hypothetical protein
MVAHRKNVPPRQGYVPSSWFIVLTVMVVIGSAGWLGWLLLDDDSATDAASAPSASPSVAPGPTATAAPTTPAPSPSDEPEATEPEPTESEEPEPEPSESEEADPEPAVSRNATVSVLNNSGITGAARAFSAKVTGAGWTLGGVGNWTGSIDGNTIYYPAGLQDEAQVLSGDVGIQRIRPSIAPMRMDRLTIILSGPQ